MSILEFPHEFFDKKTQTKQLYQAFCNHVYCGQWLLARITLEIIYPHRLILETNFEDLLTDIIRNPTAYCTESRAVPTPFHFALLLLDECRSKQYLDNTLLNSLKHEMSFKFLLAVGDIQPTPQVVQEFDRIHTSTDVTSSSLLTNTMADFLVDLWLNEIPRVCALVRLYLNTPIPSIQQWLIQIHKRALEETLQQLKSSNKEQKKNHLIDLLLSLYFYPCESNEFRSIMKDILKKIVLYASEANNLNGQLFNLKLLYRSVLPNEHLAKFISDLESECRRDSLNNEIVLIHFMKKNSFEKENMFWKELYLYLIENKTDLITCVLNDAISMMQNRDYSSLDQLLSIKELNCLQIHIFLVCWTYARTINDASVFYESIHTLENKNPFLEKCLKLFQSHIDFIAWLSKVRRIDLNHDGATSMANTSDLLALLHTNSPLALIHRYLDIQTMNSEEILQKIRTTSMNLVDDDESIRDRRIPKSVRFDDEPEVDLDSLRLPQVASSMIFIGYLAINTIIQRVLPMDLNQEPNNDLFTTAKSHLTQIFPLRFRLEILENIFSLIFIQQSELKIDETIDIIEQSVHSTSTSLSNSEKLISSTRSNGLEDSLLTSRDASNRPQLSIGRSIQDLEELGADDDNVSICSSSMSSVGASHPHGMYRSGLLIDHEALFHLLNFVREQIAEIRSLSQKIKDKGIDRDTVTLETSLDKFFNGHTIQSNEQFDSRATKLSKTVSDVLWRYNLLTSNTNDQSKQDNRQTGQENDDRLVHDTSIKNLMLPLPHRRHRSRKQRRSRLSETSASSVTSSVIPRSSSKNVIVSQILSSRDNLLAICLKEGKITEANEVIRIFHMQDHPLAVEAGFSKLFRDTLQELAQSDSMINTPVETSSSMSVLADIANLTSAALGNASLQSKIKPLLEMAQSPTVSSTLPISNYFDHEHFASLTLFDLAINAPSMNISKILLDMAQHRLPMSKSAFVSTSSLTSHNHSKSSSTTSSNTRIKTLHEMINSYANLANASVGSFQDLLVDATIPLDGNKATKIIQYYKKLDDHCRQYYNNEKTSISLEQQMKISGELFENDPIAKFDLITYIKNGAATPKLTSSTHVNYFALFYTYLQNFRLLLEQFPIHDSPTDVDFTRNSPLTLVQRIVARSSDIDLGQLQLMTSKLNIDISLAVSLNIIRPLFADKTIASSTLSTSRQTTLLQQQRIDIFTYRQQAHQQMQMSQSISTTSLKRPSRRSGTILQRSISRGETNPNESNFIGDHPEVFVRIRLTRLLDLIRKIIQDSGLNHFVVEQVEKLALSDEYDDILNSIQLLAHLDLVRLGNNEERLCFFANLYNLLIIISHIELIRTTYTKITTTKLFRNDLERLLFMFTTRLDVGQLKQISLFDLRHYILRQTVTIDGLDLNLDANRSFHQFAPQMKENQHIKVGLVLNDCIYSSVPFVILTPELVNEQLQRLTRDFIDKCVPVQTNDSDKSMLILVPEILQNQFHRTKDQIVPFIAEYSSNNDVLCAINEHRTIKTEMIPSRTDFVISFDYRTCTEQCDKRSRRRRTSSLPSTNTVTTLTSSMDFLPSTNNNLPNHLIDNRTIAFVQEKSPALGQILHIYVQSVVHNQPIETDRTPLKTYFTSLLLSPSLIKSKPAIADEWFRSIVLNDLTYQHDLLLDLSSSLWSQSKYIDIVKLFDSLLPAFIVHSPYCQILRDLALLSLIKKTTEPDRAYHYLRKIHDCHLLVFATIHYLPRFDGPTCLKLLQLCLTSCKKFRPDYVDWVQERLNVMYVYKALCLGALAQFNKCMAKIAKDENQSNTSMEDLAIRKTSSKCLTWQRAEEHSQTDPLAVVDMFILEKQFDMGHEWLKLLKNKIDESVINRVRYKLVVSHIHWLLEERNIGDGNKILQIIDTIENINDKWLLCKELIDDLSEKQSITDTKSIPFSRLFVKYRIIQYMLENFEENSDFFQGVDNWSKLSVLATGLAIFFNCIPLEQTDSYVHLVAEPLLILEQLLMNSATDIAKTTIEMLKVLIQKYSLEKIIQQKQIDDLIEFYTKKSVKLNVVQPSEETSVSTESKPAPILPLESRINKRRKSLDPLMNTNRLKEPQESSPLGRLKTSGASRNVFDNLQQRKSNKTSAESSGTTSDLDASVSTSPGGKRVTPSTPIPISTKDTPPQSLSVFDYLSSSFSGRGSSNETSTMSQAASTRNPKGEFTVPITATPKKLWIPDDEVSVCMCCNETSFSMFNRRHHCRHCGRVVCKGCSSHLTQIKDRLERTCNDCYQQLQNNATKTTPTTTRPEPSNGSRKVDLLRAAPKLTSPYKRKSITELYLKNNGQSDGANSMTVLGTSFVNDRLSTVHEEPTKLSSSLSTASALERKKRQSPQSAVSPLVKEESDYLAQPIINDQVHHILSGTSTDKQFREDFHYDQSPSISLCLSLIELHSNQYQCGKLLINLCEYLSEQLSSKQRNVEIDYGLVLNIIRDLLGAAKIKLTTATVDEIEMLEQQKLIASCETYCDLVDILNSLNMVNFPLPALNDLLQSSTRRRIRNQLIDDERYELATDITSKYDTDTQMICFQWGMAYLQIGRFVEARDKFEKCLEKYIDDSDRQRSSNRAAQEKMVNDIITQLESLHSLRYSMKHQYLIEAPRPATHQRQRNFKYLNTLHHPPPIFNQANKIIEDEIRFYLTTYSDDAHLIDYYIRHGLYSQAFQHKCSLNVFRDNIYLPLLKRNQINKLFSYISTPLNHPLTHHLKFVSNYLKDQDMHHSLQQLLVFMNDYMNAAFTSIKIFTTNRTNYLDLCSKRLVYLLKAIEYFKQANIDTEQTMNKVQNTKKRINLQIEVTRYIDAQLKRLGTNGADIFVQCPTLFDNKEATVKLISGLIVIADPLANAFSLIHQIIQEIQLQPEEIFIPCAEAIGKRRDYRLLQQLLQLMRDHGYIDNVLHDNTIEACIRETGSDVAQSREQDTIIQMIKNDDKRISVYSSVGKLRAAYLIAIRLGREEKVRSIRDDAQKSGQTAVFDMCKKWLENRASEQ